MKNMDSSRIGALAILVLILIGGLYLSGEFIYGALHQVYGPKDEVQIVQYGFLEDKLESLQKSFEQMQQLCSEEL